MEVGKIVKVTGLCVYCGRPAKRTCPLCGALICEVHTDAIRNICVACSRGKR